MKTQWLARASMMAASWYWDNDCSVQYSEKGSAKLL